MFQERLGAEEWKSAVIQIIEIINRQYCIISESQIGSDWDDSCGNPQVTLEFPNRSFRIAFESLWSEVMQGHCWVRGDYTLVLVYY